ncbi:unnamed protein product [Amoebophrya sp. A120]|nr:unnamed protein product [Amoebophrya sp. A120]|eukprot:GSA120T00021296001.1
MSKNFVCSDHDVSSLDPFLAAIHGLKNKQKNLTPKPHPSTLRSKSFLKRIHSTFNL